MPKTFKFNLSDYLNDKAKLSVIAELKKPQYKVNPSTEDIEIELKINKVRK